MAHHEIAATRPAVAVMRLGGRDAGDADERCGRDGRETRCKASGHDQLSSS
jgi:hypothetical protein